MISKKWVLQLLEEMPEKFSVDDFLDKIISTKKIEIALERQKKGEFLTEEELDDEVKKWF